MTLELPATRRIVVCRSCQSMKDALDEPRQATINDSLFSLSHTSRRFLGLIARRSLDTSRNDVWLDGDDQLSLMLDDVMFEMFS
jgi:hypothetical protein